jgi:hypothetical protein
MGYLATHHINKIMDWLNIQFGTHYGIETFKLQQEIRDAVKKIADRDN